MYEKNIFNSCSVYYSRMGMAMSFAPQTAETAMVLN
jgi:hypothetical protein